MKRLIYRDPTPWWVPLLTIVIIAGAVWISGLWNEGDFAVVTITALVIGSAIHVVGHDFLILCHICSGIPNWDSSVTPAANILFHISRDGFHVRCAVCVGDIINDFVAGKESESVRVIGEGINGSKDTLQVHAVVRFFWLFSIQRVLGRVGVEYEIYSGVGKSVHAIIVVLGIVDGVDSNRVDAEFGEVGNVSRACS